MTARDREALAYYLGPKIPRSPGEKALYQAGKAVYQGRRGDA
jgi:hypothetical protein